MKSRTLLFLKTLALLACLPLAAMSQSLTDYGAVPPLAKPPGDQTAANQKLDFHTDLFTGRFNYRVPIEVPPGRQGSEPAIALQYNSANQNGWCGVGWDLDMGYIQRETRYAVPVSGNAYNNYFVYSIAGQSGRLVLASDGTYRPEINTAFLKFVYANGYWIVTDKDGRQYTFGGSANARIATAYGTFKWALSQIADANGNVTTLSYQTADASLQIYPYQISYNTNGNLSANCVATFTLSAVRADIPNSCLSGVEIDTTRLLQGVAVTCNGNQVRRYALTYSTSPSTGRSLLYYVTEYGTDDATSWPAMAFSYSVQSSSFQPPLAWAITPQNNQDASGYSPSSPFTALIDINGDGLPDWVTGKGPQAGTPTADHFNVQINNGNGFGPVQNWTPLGNEANDATWNWSTVAGYVLDFYNNQYPVSSLIDINGDGLPDRVMRQYTPNGNSTFDHFQVQTNTGTGFGNEQAFTGVANNANASFTSGFLTYPFLTTSDGEASLDLLADMNGDGYPDRVMIGSQSGQFDVQLNNRNGTFSGVTAWGNVVGDGPIGSYQYSPRCRDFNHVYSELMDMNGDGLPDRVMQNGIQLNNGVNGFGSLLNWNYGGDPETVSQVKGAYTTQWIDINGDGLPDYVLSNGDGTYTMWFNTGKGFSGNGVTWTGVNTAGNGTQGWADLQSWDSYGTKVMFIDMNGDGLPDRVIRNYTGNGNTALLVQLNSGPYPDLLIGINNGMGGSISTTYEPATWWNNTDGTHPRLALPLYTVTSVHVDDGIRAGNTWTYTYTNGLYDAAMREFRGFGVVTETDLPGRETVTYFHQGGGFNRVAQGEYQDSRFKAGMPYDIITYGSDHQFYKETLNQVAQVQLDANGVFFPFVTNVFEADAEPGAGYRATLKQYRYDVTPNNLAASTGNLLQTAYLGEVNNINYYFAYSPVPDPIAPVYTTYAYAALSNTNILDKPASITVSSDAAGNHILRQTICRYFGATGNLQQKSEQICASVWATNTYTYDNYGNVQTITDPVGIVTALNYDAASATFPVRQSTGTLTNGFKYDPRSGALFCATNAQGMVTSNAYDALLRLTNAAVSTTAYGAPTLWRKQFQYSLGGIVNLLSYNSVRLLQNDPAAVAGYHETYTYLDGLGRPIQTREQSETAGQYRVNDIFYNERGEVMAQMYPVWQSGTAFVVPGGTRTNVFTAYDPIGRVAAVYPCATSTFASGGLTGYPTPLPGDAASPVGPTALTYGDGSNPWAVLVTDPRGKVRKYLLDSCGRTNQIVEVTGAGNFTTTLAYNPVGDLTNITDSAGNRIAMFYDLLGRKVALADPDLGFWQYDYDLAGRLQMQTDAKNQKTLFYYNDAAGRLTRREGYTAAGQLVATNLWAYDSNGGDAACTVAPGQVYQITDDQGWQKFSYDSRNRMLKTIRYLAKNGNYYTNLLAYDDADRLTATVYPNGGPTVTNLFDTGGHLSQVRQSGGGGTVFYAARGFNELGQLTGVNFGNGVGTTLGYYPASRRLQQVVTAKTTNVQSLAYSYDATGNLSNVTDAVYAGAASGTIGKIQYDDLNRLVAVTNASGTFAYAYNPVGNVLTNTEAGASNYVYGSIRPHAVRSANGQRYTYDQNGNVALRGRQHLFYDVNNRLNLVWSTNGVTTTFGYSADGARLWEQSGTNALQVWVGDNYEEKQGLTLYHVYAGGRLVATFDKSRTNLFQYYHPDDLGSTSIQTDTNGAPVQNFEYSAYGQSRYTLNTNATKVSRRYTGQVLDEATGLYYYNARYYDAWLGRFIQPDDVIPDLFNPQSYNRYSYCVNNPLRYTDPTGHDYVGDVGLMFVGYYQAGAGLVTGTAFMVAHPITTAQGIGTAVAHPVNTVSAIGSGIAKDWNSGAQGQGRVVGGALLAVGMALAPGAEAGNLAKAGEVANAGSKTEEVAGAAAKTLGKSPGPTVDPATGQQVQRFIVDPKGNTMIEPAGGTTKPWGRGGADTHTTYPNGSPYQRLDYSHGDPHGHGQLPGTGPGKAGTGPSLNPSGNVVPNTSPEAHWPVKQ